jgi:adenylate kinase family enzyme
MHFFCILKGSGKTALAKRLAKKLGFVYISTNEIIKDMIAKKMKLSKMALEHVIKGELGPIKIKK